MRTTKILLRSNKWYYPSVIGCAIGEATGIALKAIILLIPAIVIGTYRAYKNAFNLNPKTT